MAFVYVGHIIGTPDAAGRKPFSLHIDAANFNSASTGGPGSLFSPIFGAGDTIVIRQIRIMYTGTTGTGYLYISPYASTPLRTSFQQYIGGPASASYWSNLMGIEDCYLVLTKAAANCTSLVAWQANAYAATDDIAITFYGEVW